MSTAFLVAVGTRGDTEPFIALSLALLRNPKFKSVHLCIQPDYRHLIPNDTSLIVHYLPFSASDFFVILHSITVKESEDAMTVHRKTLEQIASQHVFPSLASLIRLAQNVNADVILATWIVTPCAMTIADVLGVPFGLFNFQPLTPTGMYPYFATSIPEAKIAAEEAFLLTKCPEKVICNSDYLSSYDVQRKSDSHARAYLNAVRSSFRLPELSDASIQAIRLGTRKDAHVFNAYPTEVVPPSADWNGKIFQVQALSDDYIPANWSASPYAKLVKYVSKHRPLCITFGSMEIGDHEALLSRKVLSAMRGADLNHVLWMKGSANLGAHHLGSSDKELKQWAEKHVYMCEDSVPFAWLFPKCRGVVCHGGAGTVFTALRAGVPVGVFPILYDQSFWGPLVQLLGVGVTSGPNWVLGSDKSVAEVVRKMLSEDIIEKARNMGEDIGHNGSGSTMAAEVVASLV